MYDMIIIGGGPAGLAAATYALEKQLNVILFAGKLGGKAGIHQHLPGQRTAEALPGEAAVQECLQRVRGYPNRLVDDFVIDVRKDGELFAVSTEQTTWQAPALVIATGAQPTPLGIPNEWALVGHGLGYSTTTHTRVVDGRDVAVVGSTLRALHGVIELLQTARRVVLIAPEPGMLESALGRRLRHHPRLEILEGYQVAAVEDEGGAVQAVRLRYAEQDYRIPVQAVFAALPLLPNTRLVGALVQLDADGFIVVDQHNQSSLPGLFAAGDVTGTAGGEQIQIALGDGVRAARYAYHYLLAQRLLISLETLQQEV